MVKFPDRFWSETIPRLTDPALAALLESLLRRAGELPAGVLRARAVDFEDTRFGWAASQIAGELAAAPGLTLDVSSGLAVVWAVATAAAPRSPSEALAAGRRIGKTASSWTRELANRVGSQLDGAVRERFTAGVAESIKFQGPRPQRPRPRADPFEVELLMAKKLERELRAGFEGVEDRGDRPSAADRIAFVNALGAGLTAEDIYRAMAGRAEKCRRSRLWQGQDTAEKFLSLAWVLEKRARIDEAIRAAPAAPVDDNTIMRGPGGTFVAGRQVFEDATTPSSSSPGDDGDDVLGKWVKQHQ